jgi:hypothetical protein
MSFSARFIGSPRDVAESLRIARQKIVSIMPQSDEEEPSRHGVKCAFEAACAAAGSHVESDSSGPLGVVAMVAGHISRGGYNTLNISLQTFPLAHIAADPPQPEKEAG